MKTFLEKPIFIVGFPRSGTTLIQSMLSVHPSIVSFPETHFFTIIWTNYNNIANTLESPSQLAQFLAENSYGSFDAKDFIPYLLKTKKSYSQKELFEVLIKASLKKYATLNLKSRILEKTPEHFLQVETILKLYPNAKFIAIIRNPLYVIQSWKNKFPDSMQTSICHLASRWEWYSKKHNEYDQLYPNNFLTVAYENLTTQPEVELKKICRFLKVTYKHNMITDYQKQISHVVLQYETWKNNASIQEVVNMNDPKTLSLRNFEQLIIQIRTQFEMKKRGYPLPFNYLDPIITFLRIPLSFISCQKYKPTKRIRKFRKSLEK